MVSLYPVIAASLVAFASASASFSSAASAVDLDLNAFATAISGWSAEQGADQFSKIQAEYAGPLSSAFKDLADASGDIVEEDIVSEQSTFLAATNIVTYAVAAYLNNLSAKANDFSSIGASSTIAGIINDISGSVAKLYENLFLSSALSDVGLYNTLAVHLSSVSPALSNAISLFGASSVSFPYITSKYHSYT